MEPNTNSLFALYFLHKTTIFCMLLYISFISGLAYNPKIVNYAITMLFNVSSTNCKCL